MTLDLDHQNRVAPPTQPARPRRPLGYGKGPLVAGSVMAAILVPLLIASGIGAASAMSNPRSAINSQPSEAPPTPDTGDESPGTDNPATPPDRDSDQTVAPPPEDTIYYIQRGDTLTALSAKFGMSIDYIANYNAVRDVNIINEGAVLRVPYIYVPPAPLPE